MFFVISVTLHQVNCLPPLEYFPTPHHFSAHDYIGYIVLLNYTQTPITVLIIDSSALSGDVLQGNDQ